MSLPSEKNHTRWSEEDRAIIERAKLLLITRDGMSESQAHRFIQKKSMDTGRKMVYTAQTILDTDNNLNGEI